MIFFEIGRVGNSFQLGQLFLGEGCPRPDLTPPKVRGGGA